MVICINSIQFVNGKIYIDVDYPSVIPLDTTPPPSDEPFGRVVEMDNVQVHEDKKLEEKSVRVDSLDAVISKHKEEKE